MLAHVFAGMVMVGVTLGICSALWQVCLVHGPWSEKWKNPTFHSPLIFVWKCLIQSFFPCYSTKKTVGETVKQSKWSSKAKLEAPCPWACPGYATNGISSSPFRSGHGCPEHQRVWELYSQHCLFKTQWPSQNPSWITLWSSVCMPPWPEAAL